MPLRGARRRAVGRCGCSFGCGAARGLSRRSPRPWVGCPERVSTAPGTTSHAVRRSRARYIASVPWRWGHSWTSGPSPRSGTPGRRGRASMSSAVGVLLEDVVDDRRGSRRGAGSRSRSRPRRRRGRRPGPAQQAALERGEALQVLGAAAPARLGAAAQGAQAGAGHVHQDPVEGAGAPRRAGAVGGDHLVRARGCPPAPWPPGPRGAAASRRRAAWRRVRRRGRPSSAALPPGPAQPSSHCSSGPSSGRVGEGEGDELAALVLHTGAALAHGLDRARLAALGRAAPRTATSGPARRPPRPSSSSVGGTGRGGRRGSPRAARCRPPAGPRCRRGRRRASPTARRRPSGGASARRRDGPRGPRRRAARPAPASRPGRAAAILRSTALTNLARPSPSTTRASSTEADTAAWVGMRVPSSWCAPRLEHVEHRRVDLAQRPVDAGGDDRVVRALAAQRAVDQLGGEGGVPGVEVRRFSRALRSSGGSTRLA